MASEALAFLYRGVEMRLFKPFLVLGVAVVTKSGAVVLLELESAYKTVRGMTGLAILVGNRLVKDAFAVLDQLLGMTIGAGLPHADALIHAAGQH